MAENTYDCCAVLLCGGKSRRMGRDKAFLAWQDGRTFLQSVAAQLDFLEEKYLSVASFRASAKKTGKESSENHAGRAETGPGERDRGGNNREKSEKGGDDREGKEKDGSENCDPAEGISPDWVLLPDRVPDCGPLGGIFTALKTSRAQWVLAASCDIPTVRRSLFFLLLNSCREDCDLVYPVTPDGRRHMTCAIYRKTLLPLVERQIGAGDYRLRLLPDLCRAVEVPVTDPALAHMLFNINTEADFQKAAGFGKMDRKARTAQTSCGPSSFSPA